MFKVVFKLILPAYCPVGCKRILTGSRLSSHSMKNFERRHDLKCATLLSGDILTSIERFTTENTSESIDSWLNFTETLQLSKHLCVMCLSVIHRCQHLVD